MNFGNMDIYLLIIFHYMIILTNNNSFNEAKVFFFFQNKRGILRSILTIGPNRLHLQFNIGFLRDLNL
jgi:hypothetical protein